MDPQTLAACLAELSVGEVRYFERLGSTNDEAAALAEQGAADMTLVVADEQTAGRGRSGRTWITPASAGLAFSLVLRPSGVERSEDILPRLAGLGALAVTEALHKVYRLPAQIKWPNDVLIYNRKVAGVLVEAQWLGEDLSALILGIGINVAAASVNEVVRRESPLRFPATSVENALGRPVDRLELLRAVLESLISWRKRLTSPFFITAWEEYLAFRGEWVYIFPEESQPANRQEPAPPVWEGQILGLASDGCLRLRARSGDLITLRVGEVRILPVGS